MDAPEFSARGGIVWAQALFGARLRALLGVDGYAGYMIYIIGIYHRGGGS